MSSISCCDCKMLRGPPGHSAFASWGIGCTGGEGNMGVRVASEKAEALD